MGLVQLINYAIMIYMCLILIFEVKKNSVSSEVTATEPGSTTTEDPGALSAAMLSVQFIDDCNTFCDGQFTGGKPTAPGIANNAIAGCRKGCHFFELFEVIGGIHFLPVEKDCKAACNKEYGSNTDTEFSGQFCHLGCQKMAMSCLSQTKKIKDTALYMRRVRKLSKLNRINENKKTKIVVEQSAPSEYAVAIIVDNKKTHTVRFYKDGKRIVNMNTRQFIDIDKILENDPTLRNYIEEHQKEKTVFLDSPNEQEIIVSDEKTSPEDEEEAAEFLMFHETGKLLNKEQKQSPEQEPDEDQYFKQKYECLEIFKKIPIVLIIIIILFLAISLLLKRIIDGYDNISRTLDSITKDTKVKRRYEVVKIESVERNDDDIIKKIIIRDNNDDEAEEEEEDDDVLDKVVVIPSASDEYIKPPIDEDDAPPPYSLNEKV